jgi:gamma-glutamyl-gamma-aminobutyrate hydrolase PuuD
MRLAPMSYGDVIEQRDALSHDWIYFLQNFHATTVLIPNSLSDPCLYAKDLGVTRLLLSGGDSLGSLSNTPEQSPRDSTEFKLLEWALSRNIPVLGVCRGLHVINAFFGGDITRDLCRCIPLEAHRGCFHRVKFVAGDLAGSEASVNSFHDQGVLQDQLSSNLEVVAKTSCGVVEALRHPNRRIEAVQWHPERSRPAQPLDMGILAKWLAE